jgi:hypothetical protein
VKHAAGAGCQFERSRYKEETRHEDGRAARVEGRKGARISGNGKVPDMPLAGDDFAGRQTKARGSANQKNGLRGVAAVRGVAIGLE